MAIRTAPKTSSGRAFDVVASAMTSGAKQFVLRGYVRMVVHASHGLFQYPLDGTYGYLGYTPSDLRQNLETEELTIPVSLYTKSGQVDEARVIIRNDLSCAPVIETIETKDGLATNMDFGAHFEGAAIEAYNPGYSASQVTIVGSDQPAENNVASGRPFFGVVPVGATTDTYYFRGPDYRYARTWAKRFGTVTLADGVQIPIYEAQNEFSVPVAAVTTPSVVTEVTNRTSPRFFLRAPNGPLVPLRFTQNATVMTDGKLLLFNAYLKALQIAVYVEETTRRAADLGMCDQSLLTADGYVIPVIQLNGHYTLDETSTQFWRRNCFENSVVNAVFKRYDASESCLFIQADSGAMGKVSVAQQSTSCMALCVAFLIAVGTDASLASAVKALPALMDAGMLKVDPAGNISGVGSSMDGQTIQVSLGDQRVAVMRDARGNPTKGTYIDMAAFDSLSAECDNKLLILGLDPWDKDKVPGLPDHYIVVAKDNEGIIRCVYDAYMADQFIATGTDVTSYIVNPKTNAILLGYKIGRLGADQSIAALDSELRDKIS